MTRPIVERLRAPAYWMSGSNDGHEGENLAPLEAADTIGELVEALQDAIEFICKIADRESNEAAAVVTFGRTVLAKARGEA